MCLKRPSSDLDSSPNKRVKGREKEFTPTKLIQMKRRNNVKENGRADYSGAKCGEEKREQIRQKAKMFDDV